MKNKWDFTSPGIHDDLFIRGNVPMTKEEVRAVTISKLRTRNNHTIVDIGAGTGSISIEAALQASQGKVYAVERNSEGIELIKKNMKKFNISNITCVVGLAPEVLKNVPQIDRAIIGGSGGKLEGIFDWLDTNLKKDGRVVINLITLENLHKSINCLKDRKYEEIDIAHVSVSKSRKIGKLTMMEAQNSVYIISAIKN